MANLTQASRELFRRAPDERFESLDLLYEHVKVEREASLDRWQLPQAIAPIIDGGGLRIALGDDGAFELNDWSFTQLCLMAGVAKDTINRLSVETARTALTETLPRGTKPLQVLSTDRLIRSVHGVAYTRLWNENLLRVIRDAASDFQPPPKGFNGATGLYAGEQDMFLFLIDPTGWIEVGGESFAPGLFAWNSEVGKRSVGCTTFWYQSVCANHICWQCDDVSTVARKHTRSVGDALTEIRLAIGQLVDRRDQNRDRFAALIRKAMEAATGTRGDSLKLLGDRGINRKLAERAVELAETRGQRFTVWSLVDALTQLSRESQYAATRVEADQKAAALLTLAA